MSEDRSSAGDLVALPELIDDDEIWRRIPPEKVIFDESRNVFRPSKDSFNDHPNGTPMSAFLAKVCKDPLLAVHDHEDFALVGVRIKVLREKKLEIVAAPKPDLPPGHVHVVGSKTDSVRKALAKNFRWIIDPPDHVKSEAKKKALGK